MAPLARPHLADDWLARLGVFVGILVLWNVAVEQEWINPIYAATPAETFDALK